MATGDKNIDINIRAKATGDGFEKTNKDLDANKKVIDEVVDSTKEATKATEELTDATKTQGEAAFDSAEFYRKMREEDEARWAAKKKQNDEEAAASAARQKARQAEKDAENAAGTGATGSAGGYDMAAAIRSHASEQRELAQQVEETRRQETLLAQERALADKEAADAAQRLLDIEKQKADEWKQKLDDVETIKKQRKEEAANPTVKGSAMDKEIVSGVGSAAARAASVKVIYDVTKAAQSAVRDLNKELTDMGGKGSVAAETYAKTIDLIFSPLKTTVTTVMELISESTVKALKDLKAAQAQAKRTEDQYKKMKEAKREADSERQSSSIQSFLDRELLTLRLINDEIERGKRLRDSRQEQSEKRDDIQTGARIRQVEATKDGAAKTEAITNIEAEAAQKRFAAALNDANKPVEDAEQNYKAISGQLDAQRTGLILFQQGLAEAQLALKTFAQNPLLHAVGLDAQGEMRESLTKTVNAKQADVDKTSAVIPDLEAQLQKAEAEVPLAAAQAADTIETLTKQFQDGLSQIAGKYGTAITETAQQTIDAADELSKKIEEEGGKVPERITALSKDIQALITNAKPDEEEVKLIATAVENLKAAIAQKDGQTIINLNAISANTNAVFTRLQAIEIELKQQAVKLQRK